MTGWKACSSSDNRGCWLKNSNGKQYDINTDYEINGPTGITRNYKLVLTDTAINADGIVFPEAKVFNDSFPGPWLQACWRVLLGLTPTETFANYAQLVSRGDKLNITVVNNLKYNGTSVHWHGIRQLLSNPADGVNGVTQCAIAPKDSYSYVWNATQYGSTWYHSHYSSQYADGVQGPIVRSCLSLVSVRNLLNNSTTDSLHSGDIASGIPILTVSQTIHGPTSAPFDEAKDVRSLHSTRFIPLPTLFCVSNIANPLLVPYSQPL
jgi:hypothetical protein